MPRASLEGVGNILKEMAAGQRSPQDFVDMSLLDEIENEGFMQRLRCIGGPAMKIWLARDEGILSII